MKRFPSTSTISAIELDPTGARALTGLDGEEPPTEPDFATGASPARCTGGMGRVGLGGAAAEPGTH